MQLFCTLPVSIDRSILLLHPTVSWNPLGTFDMSIFRISVLLSACLYVLPASPMDHSGRAHHGLIGYGISMYSPLCAYTCRDLLSTSTLDCSEHMHMSDGMDMDMGSETSPECYATDTFFLETLAYCISTHCQGVSVWDLEKYWNRNVAGKKPNQPVPQATYQQTLANISAVPTDTLVLGEDLNKTMITSDEDYEASYNAQDQFERMEVTHETYGYVCFAPCL